MKTTAVARILSCMHNVETEKNAEMHKRMFFKSVWTTVICGDHKECQFYLYCSCFVITCISCFQFGFKSLTSSLNMNVHNMALKLIIADCHVMR
jgi:hypothetical protein